MEHRIRASFAQQSLMRSFGASVAEVAPGRVVLEAPISPGALQQHGAGHAGLTFALADTAAGYAALTLMPEGREVMTVEAKINLMAPCLGDRLVARGEVAKAGRRLTVCRAEVLAIRDGRETCIALMQATMIPVDP